MLREWKRKGGRKEGSKEGRKEEVQIGGRWKEGRGDQSAVQKLKLHLFSVWFYSDWQMVPVYLVDQRQTACSSMSESGHSPDLYSQNHFFFSLCRFLVQTSNSFKKTKQNKYFPHLVVKLNHILLFSLISFFGGGAGNQSFRKQTKVDNIWEV